jgi:hypothetical protein
MSGGYAVASTAKQRRIPRITGASSIKRARQYTEDRSMRLTFKQRIRNWLMDDSDDHYSNAGIAIVDCEGPDLDSQGFRLKIYGASGGTIIETTKYDRKSDENRHSLHVVTEDKDLGEELAKIITMEQLR